MHILYGGYTATAPKRAVYTAIRKTQHFVHVAIYTQVGLVKLRVDSVLKIKRVSS